MFEFWRRIIKTSYKFVRGRTAKIGCFSEEPRVHTLDNGIIVTIKPRNSDTSTMVLSGTWQKFLHFHRTRTDVAVHGAEGPFGFNTWGQLDEDWTTFTCMIHHKNMDRDLSRLSKLEMVKPWA